MSLSALQSNRAVDGRAFPRESLRAVFQPIYKTGRTLAGFEALARRAEDSSRLHDGFNDKSKARHFDLTMVANAARFIRGASNIVSLPDDFFVSVNVMPDTLAHADTAEKVKAIMDRTKTSPAAIKIEIHENAFPEGCEQIIYDNLRKLSAMGCLIICDDFYSASSNLQRVMELKNNDVPVRGIKIDKSVIDMNPAQQQEVFTDINTAIRFFGRKLETILEGATPVTPTVSTHVQGFGFSRPLPEERAYEALRTAQLHAPRLAIASF